LTSATNGACVHYTFADAITAADLAAVIHHTIELEGRIAVTPDRLIDLGPSTTLAIGFNDIANLAQLRRTMTLANTIRTALIVHSTAQQGYARMFQTLNDHPSITIAVFFDGAAAEAWLREPRGSQ